MTPIFVQTAGTPVTRPEESSVRPALPLRLVRLVLVPAFVAVALVAAACGSSSPPSPSASANALISQGRSAESHGESQQALKDFTEAAGKNPASAIAYYDLGVVYQQSLNDANQAANEYNKAILADPSYQPALFNLATLEASSNPQGAIGVYNQLLKLNPNDVNVLFNLGLLLIAQNQGTQGHADLKKAISLDPSLASRVPKGITP